MQFCSDCGEAMVKADGEWICRSCDPDAIETATETSGPRTPPQRPAALDDLPTTDNGSVRKQDAMKWLNSLETPSDRELKNAFQPKPTDFSGSTYPTSISNVRITGDAKFVETVAALLQPIQDRENSSTRVSINLQQTEDKETGQLTGNYALYLSIAERG
jgi:uncharacterized Zn finger protein (UPF0148 family)